MQEIQNEYKFLPKDALKYVAEKVDESEAELYGVATFYENFSMNEKGKYIIKVCNGTACHVRKSDDVQEAIYAATGLTPEDHISSDGLFTMSASHASAHAVSLRCVLSTALSMLR